MGKNNIIEIKFDNGSNEVFDFEEKTYSAEDLVNILNTPYGTIRSWWQNYDVFLESDKNERPRKFTECDLEVFRNIKVFMSENKTRKECDYYLQTHIHQIRNKVIKNHENVEMIQKKCIQSLIQTEVKNSMNVLLKSLSDIISNNIKQNIQDQTNAIIRENRDIKNELQDELTKMVSDKLNIVSEGVKKEVVNIGYKIEEVDRKTMMRDVEMVNTLKSSMEHKQKIAEDSKKEEKGFWSKFFK